MLKPQIPHMFHNGKWLLYLALVVTLFFWKILFTNQFSVWENWEGANQAYAWHNFAATSIQRGISPLWDPYTFSGHPFVGEMQAGLFYPLKLFLYLWPLGTSGILSARLLHVFLVLAHLLGACFMFFLAKELGVKSGFGAFISALCFGLGGFVGNNPWPNILDSAIWLPLIFLFLLRALRTESSGRGILYASLGGLCLGMSILAGSLHVPIMNAIAVVTAGIFFAWQEGKEPAAPRKGLPLFGRCGLLVLVVGIVSFAAAAIQLLPSIEYSALALRWTGDWADLFRVRIPYAVLSENYRLPPHSVFAFLFGAADVGDSDFSPYFGIMPLILAVIGVWRNWHKPWVKYLAGLGLVAFFYGLGSYSLLHGLLYAFIPYLDKAREASRIIYLTHFSMALLAGFGVESLFAEQIGSPDSFFRLNRILQWSVIAGLLALGIPALYGKPQVSESSYATLLFLIGSWATFLYVIRGNRAWPARFILVAVIVCDLSVFDRTILNKMHEQKLGKNYLEQLLSTRELADFFKSQSGLFRIHLEGDSGTNMGDAFGVQTTRGSGVTMLKDYLPAFLSTRGLRLLNVRYLVSRGKDSQQPPIYSNGPWKVYENSAYCPRAWVVHRAIREPSTENTQRRLEEPDFDPLRVAFVSEPLATELEAEAPAPPSIAFNTYQADRMQLTVGVPSRAMLVLSEIYYPGWEATVNGQAAHIYKVDGLLRGVVVSAGENRIMLRYRPRSILVGAALTAFAFAGTFIFTAMVLLGKRASGND